MRGLTRRRPARGAATSLTADPQPQDRDPLEQQDAWTAEDLRLLAARDCDDAGDGRSTREFAATIPSFTPADPRTTGPMRAVDAAWDNSPHAASRLFTALGGREGGDPPAPLARTEDGRISEDPVPPPSRLRELLDDRKELPFFKGTLKQQGWCGLHFPRTVRQLPERRNSSLARWHDRSMDLIRREARDAQDDIAFRAREFDAAEARLRRRPLLAFAPQRPDGWWDR